MLQFLAALVAALLVGRVAMAQITVGAVLSLTGPGASLGIPARNVIEMLPREIGGTKIRYVVFDDGTDTAKAIRVFQKLITDERVDLVLGPTVTPTSLAVLAVAGASGTPMISLAGSEAIIVPQEGDKRWAFKLAAPDATMLAGPLDHLKAKGGRTITAFALVGAFGDGFTAALNFEAERRGLRVTGVEKYSLTDVSVTPQTLRILAQKPDAVFIAASGPAGALPVSELRNRGYAGMIIHNQGIANPDFLRAAGRAAEGLVLSASPVTVAEQLPADHPLKPAALEFVRLYEGRHGAASRSQFGALAWDGYLLFARAAPKALATARPGTPEFRTALRDAMEREQNLAGAGGLYSMSPGNHNGTDGRSLVLITVRDGAWHLLK